ncbi:Cyclin-dependent kinase 2 [Sparganum proliferum]
MSSIKLREKYIKEDVIGNGTYGTVYRATGNVLFAGDSEIDQLFLIFRKFGTPNEETWPGVSTFPDYCPEFPQFIPRSFGSRQIGKEFGDFLNTEYRRSKDHLHVLTNYVEPGFELTPSSTPPMGQRCRIEGSNTELLRWTTKNMPEPPQSSFLDGLSYSCDVVAASADCLI